MALAPRIVGGVVAALALGADQAHKSWMLHGMDIGANGPVSLAPFLDLVLVWNKGVSYGLFAQNSDYGRWFLIAISVFAAILFSVWLLRSSNKLAAISLGLIIGGALGNGLDRIIYGAVADFFHFHIGTFSWYVFNLADIWIVAGVAGLMYDNLVRRPGNATNVGESSGSED
jgi:signal peptidase II